MAEERQPPPGFDPACIHTPAGEAPTHEEIAIVAYAIWENRIATERHGDALSDWYEAVDWLTYWKDLRANGGS